MQPHPHEVKPLGGAGRAVRRNPENMFGFVLRA
jgi:hypothetical protein